jgi:hypothetical protein
LWFLDLINARRIPVIMVQQKDKPRRWSRKVTARSNALDLDPGVFTLEDPRQIARSLQRSAERSRRRKSDPFRSAMSMLNFYINRAGKTLSRARRAHLEAAKDELRTLFGKPRKNQGRTRINLQ